MYHLRSAGLITASDADSISTSALVNELVHLKTAGLILDSDVHSIYRSTPLHESSEEIRLIEIVSVSPEIVCKLSVASLGDEPTFRALSYVWGDARVTRTITVNGRQVEVTKNLADALQGVYHTLEKEQSYSTAKVSRLLWVDALCINQKNVHDKNYQVPLMKKIYSSAERVFAWMGEFDPKLALSFEAFWVIDKEVSALPTEEQSSIEWVKRCPALCRDIEVNDQKEASPVYHSIRRFLEHPYWSRVWILQEGILANDLWLMSGTSVLEVAVLLSACSWLNKIRHRYDLEDRPNFIDPQSWIMLKTTHVSPISLLNNTKYFVNLREEYKETVRGPGFFAGFLFVFHQATHPKDYVYGYCGLTGVHDDPDYSEKTTVAQVYCSVVNSWFSYCFESKRSGLREDGSRFSELWFLSNAGIGYYWDPVPGLPSWAPNFAGVGKAKKKDRNRVVCRRLRGLDADLGVFTDFVENAQLKGLAFRCPAVQIGKIDVVGPRIDFNTRSLLQLRSAILECISRSPIYRPSGCHTLVPVVQALRHNTWKSSGGTTFQHILPALCVLWSIEELEEDNGKQALTDPKVNELRIKEFLSKYYLHNTDGSDANITNETENYSKQLECSREETSAIINSPKADLTQQLCDEFQKIVFNKDGIIAGANLFYQSSFSDVCGSSFAETENGYIGIFPPRLEKGDIVCILKGCSTPVLLRKVSDHYEHVGTCFVPGLMDGEAAGLVKTSQENIQLVEIY